jgi:chromosome segregation ATPase
MNIEYSEGAEQWGTDIDMVQSAAEQRIAAVERIVALHDFRLDESPKELDAAYIRHRELEKEHTELRRETDRKIALLEREIDELKKRMDDVKKREEEWGRKLWMILPPVVAVLVSNAITLLITIYVKK